ncbi:hypothetical protein TgHK011_006783 [Trichoderma gracile]|nr:hypothetical protein TgHK011_006783 [Trichoderma gracile]
MAETVADLIATHDPKGFVPLPTLAEATKEAKPRLTIVVACVDPRCSVDKFIDLNLGVPNGEMVMVSRNAGGHIRHAVRDILLLDARFGIDELVIEHSQEIDQIYWGGNTDMAASVRNDLEWLRQDKLIRQELKNTARGFLFDIKTGKAEEIVIS